MNLAMTDELRWLILTALLTGLMWVPYIVNRLLEQGVLTAIWDPLGHTDSRHGWARRMMRAHENAVENLVVFSAVVLVLSITGTATETTAMAAMVYFYARIAHYVVFTLGVPVFRVLAFLTGVAAQLIIGLTALGMI